MTGGITLSSFNPNDPLGLGYVATTLTPIQSVANGINANRAVFMRCISGGAITNLYLFVQVASGNYDVAIYPGTTAGAFSAPSGTKKFSLGSTAMSGTGLYTISLGGTVNVVKGDWIAVVADNSTARFGVTSPGALGAAGTGLTGYADTAFPLASTAPAMTAGVVTPVYVYGA